jgi:hypothetical protein
MRVSSFKFDNALLYRTNLHALRLVRITHAIAAHLRVNDKQHFALGDGRYRALRPAKITSNAGIRDYVRHVESNYEIRKGK